MSWAPFIHREFDDVPRSLLVTLEREALFLVCAFDARAETWEPTFSVYSRSPPPDLASWWWSTDSSWRLLGHVPVSSIEFDPTRRASVNLESLRGVRG